MLEHDVLGLQIACAHVGGQNDDHQNSGPVQSELLSAVRHRGFAGSSALTVDDVLAVDEGHPSGSVLQCAQDEVEARLLGTQVMPQADHQCIRHSGIT